MANVLIDLAGGAQSGALAFASTTNATGALGQVVDMQNATDPLNATLSVGAYSSGAGTSATFAVQECATTNGTFVTIPGMTFSAVTGTNQRQVLRGLRTQRYVQLNLLTFTGTTITVASDVFGQKKYSFGSGGTPGSNTGVDRAPSS